MENDRQQDFDVSKSLQETLELLVKGQPMRDVAVPYTRSFARFSNRLTVEFNPDDRFNLKAIGFEEKTGYPLSYNGASHSPFLGKKTTALVFECATLKDSQRTELMAGISRQLLQNGASSAFCGYFGHVGIRGLLSNELPLEKILISTLLVAAAGYGISLGAKNIAAGIPSLKRAFNVRSYGIAIPLQEKEEISPKELASALKNVHALIY